MTQCNRFIDNQIFCYDVKNKKYLRKHERNIWELLRAGGRTSSVETGNRLDKFSQNRKQETGKPKE